MSPTDAARLRAACNSCGEKLVSCETCREPVCELCEAVEHENQHRAEWLDDGAPEDWP